MIFWQIIPVLISYEKSKKNSNRQFLGSISRSGLCEYGPKIVEKKYTVAQSNPDVTSGNKKKSSIRPGYYMRGLQVC
jgi:hypothetical protein